MTTRTIMTLKTSTALAGAVLLAACGGGGGINSSGSAPPPTGTPAPSPTPTPTPTPAPAPTPTPSAEYRNSAYAVAMNAQAAYDAGLTGKGVTIAVLDTGIDVSNPEFAGRISPDSKSFDVSIARCGTCAPESIHFDLQDSQGHGTETASVAAAAANGSGVQGVAPGATILALKIAGADLNSVTPTSTIKEAGVNGSAIAPAISYAIDKGAFISTLSVNGVLTPPDAAAAKAAMDRVRSVNGLVVESIANTTGDSYAGQIGEALVGIDKSNKDWFLFGIRVNPDLSAPTANGTPGALADRTLAVVATDVQVAKLGGGTDTVTGNSFAAPAIAGAAALLKQYWPQLGGKEISRILLDTARDLGPTGVDQQYGAGLLDVANALKAQTPTVTTSALKTAATAAQSLTFGGALGSADGAARWARFAGQATAVDRYGRNYMMNLGLSGNSIAPETFSLYGTVGTSPPTPWSPAPMNQAGALELTDRATSAHPVTTASRSYAFRLSDDMTVSGQTGGAIDGSQLVTGSMLRAFGLAGAGTSTSVRSGRWGIGFASSMMARRGSSALTRRVDLELPGGFTAGVTAARETGSALGLRGTGDYRIDGAASTFVTIGWHGRAAGFGLSAEGMAGRTNVRASIPTLAFDPMTSSGFRVRADHAALGGLATLGVTSPMHADRAPVRLTGPTGFDYASLVGVDETRRYDLAPVTREIDAEFGWTRSFGSTWLSLGGAYGVNAGNQRGVGDVAGWIRMRRPL